MLARTTKQGNVPLLFPKDTTEWREWVLNRDYVVHDPGALTTRSRCRLHLLKILSWQKQEEKSQDFKAAPA